MDKITIDYIERRVFRGDLAVAALGAPNKAAVDHVLRACTARGIDDFRVHAAAALAVVGGMSDMEVQAKLSDLQKEYRSYFRDTLEEFDATSPAELEEGDKPKFFNKIKRNWKKGEGPK